eukprot:GCRY01000204.1.p1 GENE.GCRY01000204.1~~GCRY01000204.1.p1  ORF type:complete len:438 (-),score=54.35 GCRY01000204.1:239-1552(-)
MGSFDTLWLDDFDSNWWGWTLEIFITCFCFLGLARVCDNYMVIALETLCARWKIREDIAGASFMAFGSAAPEIIVNCVTTIKSQSSNNNDSANLGVGAIMGSGMIAFSLIPGVCGLFSEKLLIIKRRPFARDLGTYSVALFCLCLFFSDGIIQLEESIILVALYVFYIFILVFAPRIRKWHLGRNENTRHLIRQESFVTEAINSNKRELKTPLLDDIEEGEEHNDDQFRAEEEEEEKPGVVERVVDLISWPLDICFKWTMPDTSLGSKHENLYIFTFVISFIWVAWFSYVISTVVERWVDLTGAPIAFFGILLVAIGAEIPDTIQSYTVAKRGYGSMAVSNSCGSQITNICVGLGLPWLIVNILGNNPVITEHSLIQVAAFFLTGALVLSFALLLAHSMLLNRNKIRLGHKKGIIMMLAYVVILGGYASYVFYFRHH